MTPENHAAILAHAEREFPRECCGLLVETDGGEIYLPCRNMAQGNDHFILNPEDYAAAEALGALVAVVHSHPDARPTPSMADRSACEASGLPWHIVSWPGKEWAYIAPCGFQAPLVGRSFAYGVHDCYALVQDWHEREHGIRPGRFDSPDGWQHRGESIFLDHYAACGWERVEGPPQRGDMIVMQMLSPVPNHAALYLGDNKILQHMVNRLSCKEVYGGQYQKHTTHIFRFSCYGK